jgi:DHA2 family multidrug resistance protein
MVGPVFLHQRADRAAEHLYGDGVLARVSESASRLVQNRYSWDCPADCGLTTLQPFLEQGDRKDWFASTFIVVVALMALVALTTPVVWELRVEEPVVNLRVLKNLPFAGGVSMGLVFGLSGRLGR